MMPLHTLLSTEHGLIPCAWKRVSQATWFNHKLPTPKKWSKCQGRLSQLRALHTECVLITKFILAPQDASEHNNILYLTVFINKPARAPSSVRRTLRSISSFLQISQSRWAADWSALPLHTRMCDTVLLFSHRSSRQPSIKLCILLGLFCKQEENTHKMLPSILSW